MVKINLNDKTSETYQIEPEITKKYLGGRGLGAYLYSKDPRDATDPNNALLLVPGLLTGTTLPSSSRIEVVSSSPLTKHYTASSAGGHFGAYLKHNGIDALELVGQLESWHYIVIEGNKVSFESAQSLLGKTVSETQKELRANFGGKSVSIATIGPAGEHLVKFATLMFDKRAAGRTGTGWHFGFKKLKAIVVVDTPTKTSTHDPEKAQQMLRNLIIKKLENDKSTPSYCTPAFTTWSNEIQAYPASNYRRNCVSDEDISKLSQEEYKKAVVAKDACWHCPLACTRIVKNDKGEKIRGAEYETVWALGANCDNFDIASVFHCNHLCDEFGMDTLSTGGVLAWYKECVDRNLINDLWSPKKMVELIKKIAYRKDLGSKLADGVVQAAKHLGFGSELIAHSKGLELPAWDPRTAIGMAINYATAPTGGDHCKGWTINEDIKDPETQFITVGKATNVIKQQNNMAFLDSAGICMFAEFMYDFDLWQELILEYTGLEIDQKKLERVGENVFQLEHDIVKKLGHSIEENVLPERIIGYEIEYKGKSTTLTKDMFDEMMAEYVQLRGWN